MSNLDGFLFERPHGDRPDSVYRAIDEREQAVTNAARGIAKPALDHVPDPDEAINEQLTLELTTEDQGEQQ